MHRITPYLAALVLGAAVALLAACGGSTRDGIPAADASDLKNQLQDVRERVDAGRCRELNGQLRQIDERIDRLTADEQLKENLRDGASQLRARAPAECNATRDENEAQTQTEPAETTPAQTTPTKTGTAPTDTTTTGTAPTETVAPDTATVAPVPPPTEEPVPPPEPEPPAQPPPPPAGSGGGAEPEIPQP